MADGFTRFGQGLDRFAIALSDRAAKRDQLQLQTELDRRLKELEVQYEVGSDDFIKKAHELVNTSVDRTASQRHFLSRLRHKPAFEEYRVRRLMDLDARHADARQKNEGIEYKKALSKNLASYQNKALKLIQEGSKEYFKPGADHKAIVKQLTDGLATLDLEPDSYLRHAVSYITSEKSVKDAETDEAKLKAAKGGLIETISRARSPEEAEVLAQNYVREIREQLDNPDLILDDVDAFEGEAQDAVKALFKPENEYFREAVQEYEDTGDMPAFLRALDENQASALQAKHGADPNWEEEQAQQWLDQKGETRQKVLDLHVAVSLSNLRTGWADEEQTIIENTPAHKYDELPEELEKKFSEHLLKFQENLPEGLSIVSQKSIARTTEEITAGFQPAAINKGKVYRDNVQSEMFRTYMQQAEQGKIDTAGAETAIRQQLESLGNLGPDAQNTLLETIMPSITKAALQHEARQAAMRPTDMSYMNTDGIPGGMTPTAAGLDGGMKALLKLSLGGVDGTIYNLPKADMDEVAAQQFPGDPDWSSERENQDVVAGMLYKQKYNEATGRDLDTDLKSKDPSRIKSAFNVLTQQFPELLEGMLKSVDDPFTAFYGQVVNEKPSLPAFINDPTASRWTTRAERFNIYQQEQNAAIRQSQIETQRHNETATQAYREFSARILNGEQVSDEELLKNPYLTPTKIKTLKQLEPTALKLRGGLDYVNGILSNPEGRFNMGDEHEKTKIDAWYGHPDVVGDRQLQAQSPEFARTFTDLVARTGGYMPEAAMDRLSSMIKGTDQAAIGYAMEQVFGPLATIMPAAIEKLAPHRRNTIHVYNRMRRYMDDPSALRGRVARVNRLDWKEVQIKDAEFDKYFNEQRDDTTISNIVDTVLGKAFYQLDDGYLGITGREDMQRDVKERARMYQYLSEGGPTAMEESIDLAIRDVRKLWGPTEASNFDRISDTKVFGEYLGIMYGSPETLFNVTPGPWLDKRVKSNVDSELWDNSEGYILTFLEPGPGERGTMETMEYGVVLFPKRDDDEEIPRGHEIPGVRVSIQAPEVGVVAENDPINLLEGL